MAASNKDAVTQIEDAGKKAGAEAERQRIAGLTAAFPNDPDFVKEATDKGWSVNDAKAAKFDKVAAENAELKTKNEELTKRAEAKDPNVEFAASDKEGGTNNAADPLTVDEQDAQSTKIWNENAQLRANFSGEKGAFQALYRHDKALALEEAKKAKATK